MKRNSAIFFQTVVVALGIGAVAFLLWEPQIEGRNAHATLFEIYFQDPFLAYAYIGSIPFFVALYQAFRALRYAGQGRTRSPEVMQALRTIRYSMFVLIGFVAGGEIFIMLSDSDDRAGGVFMGILITFVSAIIATTATAFERRILQTLETGKVT